MPGEAKASLTSSPPLSPTETVEDFIGIKNEPISDGIKKDLNSIFDMAVEGVGDDKALDLIKAIDKEQGSNENKFNRIKKILNRFIEMRRLKLPLDELLEQFGDSMEDIEKQAVSNGNWAKFLRRASQNRKGLK